MRSARLSVHLQLDLPPRLPPEQRLPFKPAPRVAGGLWAYRSFCLSLVSLLVTPGSKTKTNRVTLTYSIWLSPLLGFCCLSYISRHMCMVRTTSDPFLLTVSPGASDVVSCLYREMELQGTVKTLWLNYINSPLTLRGERAAGTPPAFFLFFHIFHCISPALVFYCASQLLLARTLA